MARLAHEASFSDHRYFQDLLKILFDYSLVDPTPPADEDDPLGDEATRGSLEDQKI
jgi:hypothetical protein